MNINKNNPASTGLTDENSDDLRKRALYDIYLSGGQIEWYAGYHPRPPENIGGDMTLEDFRTREAMWQDMARARHFMTENLPFWEMEPAGHLVLNESEPFGGASVFAKTDEVYAIYLPEAQPTGEIDLTGTQKSFQQRWYNPRTGEFVGKEKTITGGSLVPLGPPPSAPNEDWVILIK